MPTDPLFDSTPPDEELRSAIEALYREPPAAYRTEHFELFTRFKAALNRGEARAAEPDPESPTGWRVNRWVKEGILAGFRMGTIVDQSVGAPGGPQLPFLDKSTYPLRTLDLASGVRIVPGGSSVRDGVYLGKGVICMPPMYANAGAYIDEGSLIDSHALVGSCAQVGKRVHLSAAAQLGGVLEPVGALPVVIEDDVLIGGNCGVYEGTVVQRRAVLGAGTILTRSTPVFDLVKGVVYKSTEDQPLIIPAEAVVVAGARAITHGPGKDWGLSLYTPVIVKYRDASTDTRVQLEDWLR